MHNFIKVGNWILDDTLNSNIRFILNHLKNERVIYAFLVDSSFKYIGICDSYKTTLKKRMERYQFCLGGSTNKRIAGLIQQKLSENSIVEIYALLPKDVFISNGVKIDIIKGLEYPLIEELLDGEKWNKN